MREEDTTKFLETNGLHVAARAGTIGGWDSLYVLTNGCSLHLDYTPREFIRDPRLIVGSLRKAFIQSNGVNIVSITLTNASLPRSP
jgi:hypothetical protein